MRILVVEDEPRMAGVAAVKDSPKKAMGGGFSATAREGLSFAESGSRSTCCLLDVMLRARTDLASSAPSSRRNQTPS